MFRGEILKRTRRDKRLTQKKLAELIKVHPITISGWETGDAQPGVEYVRRLATALEVPMETFLDSGDEQPVTPPDKDIPNDVAVEPMPSGKKIKVPLLSEEITACCGGGIPPLSVTNDASILYEYTVSELGGAFDEIRPPFALKADGACLERSGIHDGYVLIVNPAIEPRQGDICIVFWNDLLSAKRVFRSVKNGVEKIQLRSDYESFDVPEDDIESGRFAIWGPVIEFRGRPRRGL